MHGLKAQGEDMNKTTQLEIDRAPRSAPTVLLLILCTTSVMAQQTVIEHCRNTSSDADRIACLEAALLGKEFAVESKSPAQIDPPSIELGAGPSDDPVDVAIVETAMIKDAPVESAEPPPVVDDAPAGIGAEQVIIQTQTRDEREESLEKAMGLSVAGYHHVHYERLVVTLENGQVWRQIKGDTSQIRVSLDRNQTVDINESGLGGYKLRLNEIRRTVRVERIR